MATQATFASTATVIGSLVINSATLAAQASPVPWLGAAFATLSILKDMVIKAKSNKCAHTQLF